MTDEWDEFLDAPVAGEEPSTFEKIKYGFSSMPSFSESIGIALERKLPLGRVEWYNDEEGFHVPRIQPPSQEMWDAVVGDPLDEWAEFQDAEDPALAVQQKEREQRLQEAYPDIHNTEYANDAAVIGGMIAGALADPTTAIPLAHGVKGAVASGAAIGASDAAAYEYGMQGHVNPETVALGAVIGGVASGLVVKGGEKFREWAKMKQETGAPITEKDMVDQMNTYGIKEGDPRLLADQLNERLGITKPLTGKAHKKKEREINKIWKAESKEADFWYKYARNQEDIRNIERVRAAEQAALRESADAIPYERADQVVAKTEKGAAPEKVEGIPYTKEAPDWTTSPGAAKVVDKRTEAQIARQAILKEAEKESAWAAREYELKKDLDMLERTAKARAAEEATTQRKLAEIPVPPKTVSIMEEAFAKARVEQDKVVADLQRKIDLAEQEEIMASMAARRQVSDVVTNQEMAAIAGAPKTPMQQFQSRATRNHPYLTNKESGGVQEDLLTHLATTSVGSGLGYAWEGEEGAVIGAVLGLGLPWAAGKTYTTLGNIYNATNRAIVNNIATPIVTPTIKLNTLGSAGKVASEKLRRTMENIDLATADSMIKTDRLFNALTKEEKAFVVAALQDVKQLRKLPQKLQIVASTVRKELNHVVREAVRVGILKAEKGKQLLKQARETGYWPRVYNEAFLSTKEGKEKWVEVFTGKNWTKDSLEQTLTSILGKDKKAIQEFMNFAKRTDGSYWLSRKQALRLLEDRGKTIQRNRSAHLEHSRKIKVQDEDVLNPFMVDDPHAVLTSYFHDVHRRIEMAKTFGAKDEIAMKLGDHIEKDFGTIDADYWRNTYFTAVGDSRSKYLTQALNTKEGLRNFYSRVNAFETLKLTFAQTINAGQALINGTSYLVGRRNPVTSYKIAINGLVKSLGKDGRAFAEQTGAAAETAILQTVGEFSEAHSIVSKKFTGLASPLEILNNPAKFLKYTGFIGTEVFQRNFAANMGRAYAEDLVAKKALIDAGKITGNKAKRILAQMDEIGIATTVPADKIPEGDMLRAALRFSNEVNFRNTPDKIPLGWNSPHAKLFTKFKSFAFHHGRFVRDNVIKKLLHDGNPMPLMNYLAVGTPLGMAVDELRRILKGDDSELTQTQRLLRGFTSVGGIGILMDTLASTAYGAAQPLMSVAGPAVSDAAKWMHGLYKSGSQLDWKPAAKAAVDTLVFPGKKALSEELKSDLKRKRRVRRERRRRER